MTISEITIDEGGADFEDVLAFAVKLPEAFLQCRDMQHAWQPYTGRIDKKERVIEQTHQCARCETKRERLLSLRGRVIRVRYKHAEGYLAKGLGRMTGDSRDAFRLASFYHHEGIPIPKRIAA